MNNHYLKMSLPILAFLLTFASCKKKSNTDDTPTHGISNTKGIYVLCQGEYNMATNLSVSTISYYTPVDGASGTVELDQYKKINGTALGNNANDLQTYGSKMYCIITGTGDANTGFVDVMDVVTGKSLKRIPFNNAQPRSVAFAKGKAYISAYNGTVSRIDTITLALEATLQLKNGNDNVGGLEGIAAANNKLYVANADDSRFPTSLKTKVTVIDIATFAKTKDIEVGVNPNKVAAAPNGDVYVAVWGDYTATNPPTMVRVSSATNTDQVIQTENYNLGAITILNTGAWVTQDIYSTPMIKSLNINTGKVVNNLITDGTNVGTPFGLTINNFDKSVVVTNSDAGTKSNVFVFSVDGKKKYEFRAGSMPVAAAFNYTYK